MADPTANSAAPHPHLLRPRGESTLVILAVFFLLFAAFSVLLVCIAFCPDLKIRGIGAFLLRSFFLLCAAFFSFLAGSFVWMPVRRKWITGSWSPSPEERTRLFTKLANRKPSRWLKFVPSRMKDETGDPRGLKLILAVIYVPATVAVIASAVHRHTHGSDLLFPVLLTFLTTQSIWDVFRKPKSKPTAAATQA